MVDQLVNSDINARRIAAVENAFGSSGQPLAVPGRVLIGEGILTKMCRKKLKPRQFFLFNDILVYGNIVINKKKYNTQHIVPLEQVKIENLDDDGELRNGWLIRTPTKSFATYAGTATEKSEWIAHINKCIEDLIKKTGKKQSTQHAAVWIPDAEATTCMHCRKSQFSMINRKHHCRKCGAVVCGPCSSKKFLLPSQSSKPLRVCVSCYDTLSKARSASLSERREKLPSTTEQVTQTETKEIVSDSNVQSSGEEDSDDEASKSKEEGDDLGLENLQMDDEKPTFYREVSVEDIYNSTEKEKKDSEPEKVKEDGKSDD